MRIKLLGFSLAGCLVALAAWLVYCDSGDDSADHRFTPAAHGAGAKPSQTDKVPEKYRETVRKGLEYLVKNQSADGHWEGDGGKHPVAMTGLVGLALLMETDKPRWRIFRFRERIAKAKYAANIRKAADWLVDQSQPGRDGLIFSGHDSETTRYMEGHGLATLFLAGVCYDETDEARQKKLTEILTRAVKYIARARSSQGGWFHTSKVEGHDFAAISATAIQIQALQAAENAGIAIPGDVIKGGLAYLKMALGEYEKAGSKQNARWPTDAAAALACGVNDRINDPDINDEVMEPMVDKLRKKWLGYCQDKIPIGRDAKFGRDELAHYYYAQTIYGGDDGWTGYRSAMFDHLQSSQHKDGCWPAGNGISVGRVYSTAVWCTILQRDNGSHPSRSASPAYYHAPIRTGSGADVRGEFR